MMKITEEELFLVLAKDGRCPKLNVINELKEVGNDGCMTACEPPLRGYGMSAALSNRLLIFEVDAIDNSMINKHILKGDMLRVRTHVDVDDGNIVLAVVNGISMIRAFWHDEDDNDWLVPMNSDYEPIMMTDENEAEIIGKVIDMNRDRLFANYKEVSEPVRKAKQNMKKPKIISDTQVSWVIQQVAPRITIARMWFAVFRALTQKSVMPIKAYDRFTMRVRKEVPNHPKLPATDEMQRMDILSFSKSVNEWVEHNAPVSGTRFYKYKEVGLITLDMLEVDFEEYLINSRKTSENSTEND